MANQHPKSELSQSPTPGQPSWRGEAVFALATLCAFTSGSLLVSWWSGQAPRPLALTAQAFWMLTIMGLMRRRKRKKETDAAFRWYRFSLAELFVIATGLAVFLGFLGADFSQRHADNRQRERLQATTAPVLGPDGQISHQPDGALLISVCDRSFDDQRLIQLARLLNNQSEDYRIYGLLFGSGMQTSSTPPKWPGITDASVPTLLQWEDMEMLLLGGTSITAEGRKRLAELEALDELSRKQLGPE